MPHGLTSQPPSIKFQKNPYAGGPMSEKVKLSKDGSSIDFVASDSLPTSMKKFRQSPEIEGFYRFIFENDLQKEAYEILDRLVTARKTKKLADKIAQKAKEKEDAKLAKLALQAETQKSAQKAAAKPAKAPAKEIKAASPVMKPAVKAAPAKPIAKAPVKKAAKPEPSKKPKKK